MKKKMLFFAIVGIAGVGSYFLNAGLSNSSKESSLLLRNTEALSQTEATSWTYGYTEIQQIQYNHYEGASEPYRYVYCCRWTSNYLDKCDVLNMRSC